MVSDGRVPITAYMYIYFLNDRGVHQGLHGIIQSQINGTADRGLAVIESTARKWHAERTRCHTDPRFRSLAFVSAKRHLQE